MATKFCVPLKRFDFARNGIDGETFVPGLKDATAQLAVYEFQDYQADRLAREQKVAVVNMHAELVSEDPVVQALYDEMLAKIAEHQGEVPPQRLDPANLVEGVGARQAPVFMNQRQSTDPATATAPDAAVLAELNGETPPAGETDRSGAADAAAVVETAKPAKGSKKKAAAA